MCYSYQKRHRAGLESGPESPEVPIYRCHPGPCSHICSPLTHQACSCISGVRGVLATHGEALHAPGVWVPIPSLLLHLLPREPTSCSNYLLLYLPLLIGEVPELRKPRKSAVHINRTSTAAGTLEPHITPRAHLGFQPQLVGQQLPHRTAPPLSTLISLRPQELLRRPEATMPALPEKWGMNASGVTFRRGEARASRQVQAPDSQT